MCLPDGMQPVLDMRHVVSALDKISDRSEVANLAGFETLTIVKDEFVVFVGEYLSIYVGFACFDMRHALRKLNQPGVEGCNTDIKSDLTAFSTPNAELITEDFPTPDYERS